MKNITYQLVWVLLMLSPSLKAQNLYPAEFASLWSDRAIYISGEDILFSGTLRLDGQAESWSEVVYVELISPTGQKINQSKWRQENNNFTGRMSIPIDVLSGYYFLRAYTKYMRNASPENYAYVCLKLVNPNTDELNPLPDSLISESASYISSNLMSEGIQTDKQNYKTEQNIHLSFDENISFSHASLSLIPYVSKFEIPAKFKNKLAGYFDLIYYPETRGPSLSGIIKDKKSRKALSFHLVNLHILGEKDFTAVISDSLGRFHLPLPERDGNRELFLIGASKEDAQVEIQIDQDYCNQNFSKIVPPYTISDEEKESILQMAQNHQLLEALSQKDSINPEKKVFLPFYGEAFKTIDFDFYVPLDSLEQYFTDIPSWVMVKKKKGKRKLSLVGTQGELKFYEPLVMLDWVPVDDIDRIMAIDPVRVKQVEIINQSYWHGDILYGGIINILTRKTDFGGIHFPESGMYLNYTFFSTFNYVTSTDLPFLNTTAWLPDFNKTSKELTLKAPKIRGKYSIILQGVNQRGEMIFQSVDFLVE